MSFQDFEFGDWSPYLKEIKKEDWFKLLEFRVEQAYQQNDPSVYPPREELFAALSFTAPSDVKCVIIGQDPYHEEGQAQGLSFSVHKNTAIPPSLRNIYKELNSDVGCLIPNHGSLYQWSQQGVLLLNSVLSVYDGKANSHKGWGWEKFSSKIIQIVEEQPQPIAYVLWGKSAQKKAEEIFSSQQKHKHPRLVLKSNHPSPLSAYRGFCGSKPFSKVNYFLHEHGSTEIDWQIS